MQKTWSSDDAEKALPKEEPVMLFWYGGELPIGTVTNIGKILIEPDLYRMVHRSARKNHECCECKKRIKRGERYQLVEGLWGGETWDRFKTCLSCADMRDHVHLLYRDGIPFGDLQEALAEEVEDAMDALPDPIEDAKL